MVQHSNVNKDAHPPPLLLLFLASLLFGSGCATNIPPSGRADPGSITSFSMRESFAASPAAGIPASIAAVRVQAPGYRNYQIERQGGVYGTGRYSIITAKEVEDDSDLERLTKLHDVGGFITLNRLLVPPRLESDRELREAAARLKADMLLLWVRPETMGRGVGCSLFRHAVGLSGTLGFALVRIESDPNAEGFYLPMGASRTGTNTVELDGTKRELPILQYEICYQMKPKAAESKNHGA